MELEVRVICRIIHGWHDPVRLAQFPSIARYRTPCYRGLSIGFGCGWYRRTRHLLLTTCSAPRVYCTYDAQPAVWKSCASPRQGPSRTETISTNKRRIRYRTLTEDDLARSLQTRSRAWGDSFPAVRMSPRKNLPASFSLREARIRRNGTLR